MWHASPAISNATPRAVARRACARAENSSTSTKRPRGRRSRCTTPQTCCAAKCMTAARESRSSRPRRSNTVSGLSTETVVRPAKSPASAPWQ